MGRMIHYAVPCRESGCKKFTWAGASFDAPLIPVSGMCWNCSQNNMTSYIDYLPFLDAIDQDRLPKLAKCCQSGVCDGSVEP